MYKMLKYAHKKLIIQIIRQSIWKLQTMKVFIKLNNYFLGKDFETNIVDIIKKEYEVNKKEIKFFPEEEYYGDTEYKWKLVDVQPNKVENLVT